MPDGERPETDEEQACPHRPRFHFMAPRGLCHPFDPNGAVWWKGRYHLFYIFQDAAYPHGGHCWGHASSDDLLHWSGHGAALTPGPEDMGIFSGNLFLDRSGVPTIAYSGLNNGTCFASADDDMLIRWRKHPGNPAIRRCNDDWFGGPWQTGDPYVWLEGESYFCVTGGYHFPQGTGDALYLFRSVDLRAWEFLGRFFEHNPAFSGPYEDCSCAKFFPLGRRHMLLCISHTKGCRYYLGRYEGGRFVPEEHHRMNWPGGTFFAPDTLLDASGRRLMWAWVMEARSQGAQEAAGWSGVMSLPRAISPAEDGSVRIEPAEELARLRREEVSLRNVPLPAGQLFLPPGMAGDGIELDAHVDPGPARRVRLAVLRSDDGARQVAITHDRAAGTLSIDSTLCPGEGVFRPDPVVAMDGSRQVDTPVQTAPLPLAPGEPLRLRVFVDRSIIEVFANGRQCVTQRVYPTNPRALGIALEALDGPATLTTLHCWQLAATNTR